ncbi:MAG: phosphoglycolate phosphatase [Gammaproteobacteria bacterium]|nr:phosphoglycolate phosphatase [Gammaproteobacteria bacterium]MDH5652109.1 phosphoglycolate phosphatase [Gammaproteobacteria bacterium]
MATPALRTVLFDLDGTLADTAPDLAYALNLLLEEQGKPALTLDDVRPAASHGSIAILKAGFGMTPDDAGFEDLRQRYLQLYAANINTHTTVFPGMAPVLDAIEQRGMNWGVVTNKPAFLTEPLLQALDLTRRCACIVSGDTLPERKPHPAPLLYACRQAGSAAAQCLYIGDAERDILAGRNAGMKTLIAMFGYLAATDEPEKWPADGMVHHPAEILDWLA